MKKVRWKVDFNKLTGKVGIKEDNDVELPIAQIITPVGNWMDNPKWVAKALEKANKIAAVPTMMNALEVALTAIDVKNGAYVVVKQALESAKTNDYDQ